MAIVKRVREAQEYLPKVFNEIKITKNFVKTKNGLDSIMTVLSSSIESLNAEKNWRLTKKSLTVISNAVSGILDGLDDGQLKRKDVLDSIQKIEAKFLPQLEDCFQKDCEKNSVVNIPKEDTYEQEESAGTMAEALKPVKNILAEDRNTSLSSEEETTKKQLARIKADTKEVPVRIAQVYKKVRAPVVAVFQTRDGGKADRPTGPGSVKKNFTQYALLDKYAIKYLKLDDYLVLENQVLLAIDKKDLEARARREQTRKKKLDLEKIYTLFAQSVVDSINERSSTHYSFVDDTYAPNPKNSNIILFWLMPTKLIDALKKSGWAKLQTWSLPL